jgi:hypothetical protein
VVGRHVEAVLALLPEAVLLEPLAKQGHPVPGPGVDLFGERRYGLGARRRRAEGVAEEVTEGGSLPGQFRFPGGVTPRPGVACRPS